MHFGAFGRESVALMHCKPIYYGHLAGEMPCHDKACCAKLFFVPQCKMCRRKRAGSPSKLIKNNNINDK